MDLIFNRILEECSDFLSENGSNPLVKTLKKDTRHLRKVKVRTKRKNEPFIKTFNKAFDDSFHNIYGRSIFCNGNHTKKINENMELVYVFPINGFKFLFNPNVEYHMEYDKTFKEIKGKLSSTDIKNIMVDMIEYSYSSCKYTLKEASFSGKEVIIYNIPYYYAVRVDRHPDYERFLSILKNQ